MNALVAITAAPIAFFVIAGLLRWPRALKAFGADPRPDRWHTSPTPAFGGIGIYTGFAVAAVAATAIGPVGIPSEMLTVVGAGGIVFAFGLLDDIVHLHPAAKLGAQLVAAYVVLHSTISVEFVSNQTLAWAIGILWLVGLTNAFNLLDNMDGLAGSLGVVAASCFALSAAFVDPNRDIFIVATALALALLGFIPYNLRPSGPARVFMGDSGSQLIGFVLASLGLMASLQGGRHDDRHRGAARADPRRPDPRHHARHGAAPALQGRSVTEGGRDHTSHRLVYRGLSERRAVLFLVAVSAALGATSLAYAVLDSGRITTIGVLVTFALLLQFAAFLSGVAAAPGESGLSARASLLVDTLVDGALIAGGVLHRVRDRGRRQRDAVAASHLHLGAPRRVALPLPRPLGVRPLPARSKRCQARYPDADRGSGGAVGARRLPLRDQDANTPRVPREDLPRRCCDLHRLPRRRTVRRAGRAEAVPLLAQARQHSDGIVTTIEPATAPKALGDRLLDIWPLLFSFLVIASLYVWQASKHPTPWLFSDEIEYAQISRAIAETGTPARRGVEYWGAGLFPWLIAPFWWIDSHRDGLQRGQDVQRARDGGGDVPDLRPCQDADVAAVCAARCNRLGPRAVLHLLRHVDGGADRLPGGSALVLRHGTRARSAEPLEHWSRDHPGRRRSVRP